MDGLFGGLRGLAARGRSEASRRVLGVNFGLLFVAVVICLLVFGMLMIYSASSIIGLMSKECGYDPAYYLVRQIIFACVGVAIAVALALNDYHNFVGTRLYAIWGACVLLLVLVFTPLAGKDALGASRWIGIGPFTLQPSEFVKIYALLAGAWIIDEFIVQRSLPLEEALKLFATGLLLPIGLVLLQPDKGTTGVILLTLIIMAFLAGASMADLAKVVAVAVVIVAIFAISDEYSRARIMTMLDPFRDEYGSGYQLVQGFFALGSGGLTGVGFGMSRQKYNYLPMAHNDFIFAVVGEELGLVGTLGLLAAFFVLLWAGFKIAQNAPDIIGKMISAGATSLLVAQMLLNVCGVVGVFPLSGKPIPFISYGGSSIISSLMLAGLVLSVSLRSEQPQTDYERRRSQLRIAQDNESPSYEVEGSTAGDVTPRSARLVRGVKRAEDGNSSLSTGLRIVDGGARAGRSSRVDARRGGSIDLGRRSPARRRGRH